jgi:hypothetical protein
MLSRAVLFAAVLGAAEAFAPTGVPLRTGAKGHGIACLPQARLQVPRCRTGTNDSGCFLLYTARGMCL